MVAINTFTPVPPTDSFAIAKYTYYLTMKFIIHRNVKWYSQWYIYGRTEPTRQISYGKKGQAQALCCSADRT